MSPPSPLGGRADHSTAARRMQPIYAPRPQAFSQENLRRRPGIRSAYWWVCRRRGRPWFRCGSGWVGAGVVFLEAGGELEAVGGDDAVVVVGGGDQCRGVG